MSKKKGLSLDEKRSKLLEIFYEKKDCFQLKEVEKYASKEKKINAQIVKEVLQTLVDDDMVTSEKIGTSVYYWAFPSKAGQTRMHKIDQLEKDINVLHDKKLNYLDQINKAKLGKEDSEEKLQLIDAISKNEAIIENLKKELSTYKDNDPKYIEKIKGQNDDLKESINIWTDNIFTIVSWLKHKFGVEEAQINAQFEIPDGLDYIE